MTTSVDSTQPAQENTESTNSDTHTLPTPTTQKENADIANPDTSTAEPTNESEQENTTQAETADEPSVLFTDFDLPQQLHKALEALGFASPTDVQEKTLEIALQGQDLMVSAQTGSGKTLGFLLPTIAHAVDNMPPKNSGWHKKARPNVLVVCPTRELVEQVTQDAIKLVKFAKGMRVGCIMGGMPYGKQLAGLKGARVVVATPGRLLDLAERKQIDLSAVSHLVLDEADRMLDLGFQEDLAKISELCDGRDQTLLFSATFADNIVGLAKNLMNEPERITLARTQDKHADISQSLFYADNNEHKAKLLNHWLDTEEINQAVIFVPTQVECDSLTERLREEGQNVINLHGGMRQFMRMKRLKLVRNGRVKLLVATDVAARGLDVPNISHVINYGLPMKHEDYVHRIGRTGRAGRKGNAITVATHKERGRVRALQQFIAQDIEVMEVEGLEPSPPPPRRRDGKGRDGRGRGRGRGRERSRSRSNSDSNRDGGYKRDNNSNRDGGFKKDHKNGSQKGFDRKGRDDKRSAHAKDGFKKDGYRGDKSRSYDRDNDRNNRRDFQSKEVDGNAKSYRGSHDRADEIQSGYKARKKPQGGNKFGRKDGGRGRSGERHYRDRDNERSRDGNRDFRNKDGQQPFKKSAKKPFKKDDFKGKNNKADKPRSQEEVFASDALKHFKKKPAKKKQQD